MGSFSGSWMKHLLGNWPWWCALSAHSLHCLGDSSTNYFSRASGEKRCVFGLVLPATPSVWYWCWLQGTKSGARPFNEMHQCPSPSLSISSFLIPCLIVAMKDDNHVQAHISSTAWVCFPWSYSALKACVQSTLLSTWTQRGAACIMMSSSLSKHHHNTP